MPVQNTNDDITLGAGEIHFAQKLPDGTYDGFRYIRETPDFSISVEVQTLSLTGSDSAVAQKIVEDEISRALMSTISSYTLDDDNLYMYFAADEEVETQAGGAVADEALVVVGLDRSFRLGVTTSNTRGRRNISSVAVTAQGVDPAVYEAGVDYEVDERRGMIYIHKDGAIDKGDTVLVSYDYAEVAMKVGKPRGKKQIEGILLFKANNTRGEDRDFEMRNVTIRASGDFSVKSREQYTQLTYQVAILEDEFGIPIYLEGEPYSISL